MDELVKEDKLVGVIGNSAGGFIAAGVFTKHTAIQSAVVMNGSCAWVRFEEQICERDNREPWAGINKGVVQALDPIQSIKNIQQRALLILHGTEDTTIPIDSQRYFMQVVEQNNLIKSVRSIEYSKVNHQITLGMLEEVKSWLIGLEDQSSRSLSKN
ncbi:alpha/beta hydrolase family protein [Paenibacillus cellulosilyticus]|uniref:alpha/beta hydrolase family protein n=1 Tax=Paenibacillus cellulosilyticus TaxID=375489 RepID=UPI003CCC827C